MWLEESYWDWQVLFQIIIHGSIFNTLFLSPLSVFLQPSSASHSKRFCLTLLQRSDPLLLPVSSKTTNVVLISSLSFWKCRNVVFFNML